MHAGLDPATPNRDLQAPLGAYGYDTGMAAAADGAAMVAWYSNAAGNLGVFAQQVAADGSPLGTAMNMPGTSNMSVGMVGRTPIVARPGGGFLDGHRARRAPPAGPALEPADSVFGAVVDAGRPAGALSAYSLTASAAGGALDALALFSVGTGPGAATYHTRILPGLTLTASPRAVRRSRAVKVRFTVLDAGDAVRGARVKVGGASGKTNAKGRVELTIPVGVRAVSAAATAKGYTRATLRLRRAA